MNRRPLAALALVMFLGTHADSQDTAERPMPADSPAASVTATPSALRVIVIETTPDLESSEALRNAVEILVKDGIAGKLPYSEPGSRGVFFYVHVLVKPDLSVDAIQQVVKKLKDLGVQRMTFGIANVNSTKDIIVTCPQDPFGGRKVKFLELQEALEKQQEFKVEVRVAADKWPVTSALAPVFTAQDKLPESGGNGSAAS